MSTVEQVEVLGKYQPYPDYQDSGVEWLGDIPSNWSVYSLKRSVTGCTNGIWGNEPNGENDLIVLRVADFDRNKLLISDDKLTYRSISEKESRSRLLTKGDLLIEKSGGGEKTLVGCVVLFDKDYAAVTSNFVAKMSPHDGYHSGFLNYAFSHLYNGRINYPSIKQTTGIQNLDSESYLMERFCFPAYTEQRTIAAFLDYETARIDKLIAQQQRLIELLKEKRQAVISHAVTKGLNPDAPMKDSGVEWLGEVPEHWSSTRIGWCCQVGNGCTPSRDNQEYWSEGDYPWLNSGKVNDLEIVEADQFVTTAALKECSLPIVPAGSIVIAITGEGKTRGSVAITSIEATLSQHLAFMTLTSNNVLPAYLLLWLESQYQKIRFESEGWGSTKAAITCSDIKAYPLPEPPLDEQLRIANYVIHKKQQFGKLIDRSEFMIAQLKERRTALISSAVTGKIDLRCWSRPSEKVVT